MREVGCARQSYQRIVNRTLYRDRIGANVVKREA
jgi:hypothetical protein